MAFRLRPLHIAFQASILCVALALASTSTFGQTNGTKLFEQEDVYISAEAAHHFFRGAVLIGISGRIVFEKAYGMGDEEWGAHNTLNTKFRIASAKQAVYRCLRSASARARSLERT
jgi:CubicO group peptidase (beta-lactamase class C family)